jgi:hypothetical protein
MKYKVLDFLLRTCKRTFVVAFLLILSINSLMAQGLIAKNFNLVPNDLSASVSPRLDLNGKACALVKVVMQEELSSVEGNVIGDIVRKGRENWLYITAGTKEVRLIPRSSLPKTIRFSDYGVNFVESKKTYLLELANDNAKTNAAVIDVKENISEDIDIAPIYDSSQKLISTTGSILFLEKNGKGCIRFKLPNENNIDFGQGTIISLEDSSLSGTGMALTLENGNNNVSVYISKDENYTTIQVGRNGGRLYLAEKSTTIQNILFSRIVLEAARLRKNRVFVWKSINSRTEFIESQVD